MTVPLDPQVVADQLRAAVPGSVQHVDEWALIVDPSQLVEVVRFLTGSGLDLSFLASLTAVDRESHFELVYHLQSLDRNHLLTLKTIANDHDTPCVPSLTGEYQGAHLQEREVFDLMGIRFEGHPDLRRMFLWDGFPGYPLRKDFLGMPGTLNAGLPGFPHESGENRWPVPGSTPVIPQS